MLETERLHSEGLFSKGANPAKKNNTDLKMKPG